MRTKGAIYRRFFTVYGLLGIAGLAGFAWVLANQGVTSPFAKHRTVQADFVAADGVSGGIGQPVNVAGVKVGVVTGVKLVDGDVARVTMQLSDMENVDLRSDASATLVPITPLKDMEVDLAPGHAATALASSAVIPASSTSGPVPLSDLLSKLDVDTRTFLTSLLGSLATGTRGREADMRQALLSLGPTTAQAQGVARAIASRDQQTRRLVTNLASVARAASRDGRLASLVAAGNQTLEAVVREELPLRAALPKLAPTLAQLRGTLTRLRPFADELGPTAQALLPATRKLPDSLDELSPYARDLTGVLRDDVRPLVKDARPVLRGAGTAIPPLRRLTPGLTGTAQTFNYLLNELAYNPPGDDEGFLFWSAWFAHNLNSTFAQGDAHGAILRATALVDCQSLQGTLPDVPILKTCTQK